MEIKEILFPVLSLGGLGLLFGLLLGFANDKFKVEVDERIPKVRECLPGANCGSCGFAGCDAYAEAVVNGEAKPNLCNPGGSSAASNISEILGISVEMGDPVVAYVHCNGTCNNAKTKSIYYGVKDCNMAMNTPGAGNKSCEFGCLGFGSCVKACKFDALEIVDGVAKVNKDNCVACGACVNACPKGIISIVPKETKVLINCNSHSKGKEVMDACSVGCIGCGLCAKNCPKEAITMVNNLPVIDYSKCVNCGICANKCPKHCIENLRKPVNKTTPTAKAKAPVAKVEATPNVKSENNVEATKSTEIKSEPKDEVKVDINAKTSEAVEVKEIETSNDKENNSTEVSHPNEDKLEK